MRPRRNDFLIPLLTVVSDILAITGGFAVSYWLRFFSPLAELIPVTKGIPPLSVYLWSALMLSPVWLLVMRRYGMYGARRPVELSSEFIQVLKANSLSMLILMGAAFFYRGFSYSRVVFVLIWGFSAVFLFLGRALVLEYEKFLYRRGRERMNVLLVGTTAIARTIAARCMHDPSLGYHLVGYVARDPELLPERLAVSKLGSLEDLSMLIPEHRIEIILVCLPLSDYEQYTSILNATVGHNVSVLVQPDFSGIISSRIRVNEITGIPFISIKETVITTWGRIGKRLFDVVFSLAVLVFFLPLGLLIALLIRLTSGSPVFYRQTRVGLQGEHFDLYKFRTMKVDAEAGSGPTWTKKNDPRITPIGRILRRYSLDEIPQFFNVLRGDMSVVGPRPERPEFVDQFRSYVPKYLERHLLKTGITGWAQVNGLRQEVPITERTKYDLYYIENWSFMFDIRIIFKTIRAVLTGKDAY